MNRYIFFEGNLKMQKRSAAALMLALAAAVPLAAQSAKPAISMDFESAGQWHAAEEPYQGKKCYKFPGNGKPAVRKFALKLKPGTNYRLTVFLRKGVCSPDEAKQIGLTVTDGKQILLEGGGGIAGNDVWAEFSGDFAPAGSGNCTLTLSNPTSVTVYLDSLRVVKTGKASADSKQKITRPVPPVTDEAAAEEEKDWLVNRRGIEALDDDFILPPFTPIELKGNTASVWGRDYTFGACNLLEQVKVLGDDLLAAPMRFTAKVNGREIRFETGEQVVIRKRKGIAEFFTRANSPDLDIEVRTAIEYDGMVKVDFTFDPRGSVQLDHFRYEILWPEKYARFIHYIGLREGGLSLNVPRISNTRRLPEGQGTVWSAPFKQLVWLGTYDRGLLWFCTSERNWSPHDRTKRGDGLRVIRKNGTVKLEITPVSEPKLIGKRTTYTFGLMATPVRPRTPGWRGTDMNYESYAKTAKRKYGAETPVIYSSGSYDPIPPATRNPAAVAFYPRLYNLDAYRKRIANVHKENRLFGLYVDPVLCSLGIYKDMSQYGAVPWDPTTDNEDAAGTKVDAPFLWQPPEVKKYYAEWRKEPISTAPYGKANGERQFSVGINSRYSDFFCYLLEKHAEAGADGIANLDEWSPVADLNPRHDMGYYEADDKRYPEYDWFARRRLLKRMCAVFYKKHGKLPLMRVHLAACQVIPIASFCDSVVTGENINSAYFRRKELMDKYTVNADKILESLNNGGRDYFYYVSPPDRWAIEYGGQAFGFNVCVISNLTKSPKIDPKFASSEAATRDYLAMCLIHDNTLKPVFCNPDPAYRLMKIKQDFHIADPEVRFHSYWAGNQPVTAEGKECYTGVWENKGQYLVAVANLSLNDRTVTVSLDPKRIPADLRIVDAETGAEVKPQNGKFQVPIPRRNYKIYRIGPPARMKGNGVK